VQARLAAADIGSNTVHILVADVGEGESLCDVAHDIEMPGLGRRVDQSGELGLQGRRDACLALEGVISRARAHGFQQLVVGATSAVRRAVDRDALLAEASARIGTPVRLLSERREAQLSLLGVALHYATEETWLMADLGGGSTELVQAYGERMEAWASLPLGSGSLAAKFLSDPPTQREQLALRAAAQTILDQGPSLRGDRLVVTGGTASHLPQVVAPVRSPMVIKKPELQEARERLVAGRAQEVATVLGVSEQRVRALRGGVEILDLLLGRCGLLEFQVSHEGLRHGMLRAYLRRGDDWWREEP
jgi:exopolyphosphatase/guanosine-5'-triphosphate,3'-diphosphate pyrophosphatase